MSRFIPNENTFIGFSNGPIGLMSAPSTLTAAAAAGDIAAGSQSYAVTAYNETGESVASTAASQTVPAGGGGVVLTWAEVPGADGYRIYGRNSSGRTLITQVGKVLTWTDSGVLNPQTAVPPTVGTASNIASPTVADVAGCVELTEYVSGLNFSAQGNVVATPNMKKLFETSIEGTSQATATMDLYRDDTLDTAWDLLPRRTHGYVIISRHGGSPNAAGKVCEVWPIRVSSRTNSNMTNNTAAMFTATFAVVDTPAEDAVVVA